MTNPAILSIAAATPPYRHAQMELHDRWLSPYLNSRRSRLVFESAEIETRHSVLATSEFLAGEPGTKARNDRYMQTAQKLGSEVISKALDAANLRPDQIDHFIVISCTGFDTPGLDVFLAAELGMPVDLRRSALIGMGCHAGVTGLDRALLEVTARPAHHVLLLSVEFGTLHFQHGDSLENIVAGAIFGDGAAAVVVGPNPRLESRPCIIDTMTYSDYAYQDMMGFYVSDQGYQIRLSTKVSKILRKIVPDLLVRFLQRSNLSPSDIRFWGIHPGGARIIDYVGQALDLSDEELRFSRNILRHYGNMSSTTIFFVLDEIIKRGRPQPDDYGILLGFGPGLTIELCLIKW